MASYFKFGNYTFPAKYIKKGVPTKPNQRQDKDSYTDGYGITRRHALGHTKTEISFTTIDMSGEAMKAIMHGITSNYINKNERDANCEYFDSEYQKRKTGHFYLDPSLAFNELEEKDGIVTEYGEMTWTFIEY